MMVPKSHDNKEGAAKERHHNGNASESEPRQEGEQAPSFLGELQRCQLSPKNDRLGEVAEQRQNGAPQPVMDP